MSFGSFEQSSFATQVQNTPLSAPSSKGTISGSPVGGIASAALMANPIVGVASALIGGMFQDDPAKPQNTALDYSGGRLNVGAATKTFQIGSAQTSGAVGSGSARADNTASQPTSQDMAVPSAGGGIPSWLPIAGLIVGVAALVFFILRRK